MNARLPAAAAAALVLLGAGCGGATARPVSLQSAEEAFSRDGVHFPDNSVASLPGRHIFVAETASDRSLAGHIAGRAFKFGPGFILREIYAMDGPRSALKWAAVQRRLLTNPAADLVVLVAKNVVYFGRNDAAARHAMASLRK